MSGAREALKAATEQKVAALMGLSDAQAAQVSHTLWACQGHAAAMLCSLFLSRQPLPLSACWLRMYQDWHLLATGPGRGAAAAGSCPQACRLSEHTFFWVPYRAVPRSGWKPLASVLMRWPPASNR